MNKKYVMDYDIIMLWKKVVQTVTKHFQNLTDLVVLSGKVGCGALGNAIMSLESVMKFPKLHERRLAMDYETKNILIGKMNLLMESFIIGLSKTMDKKINVNFVEKISFVIGLLLGVSLMRERERISCDYVEDVIKDMIWGQNIRVNQNVLIVERS